MLRIWARTTQDLKITRSYIYTSIDKFSNETFRLHVEKICNELDIPSPIILDSHITNYIEFNNTTFLARDFIESVDFEKLILENAIL